MIVLIDNYDSFSYNVYQLIGSVAPDIKVVRNDEYSVKEIASILGKKEATILTWLRRARKCLKEMLEGSDIYEEI